MKIKSTTKTYIPRKHDRTVFCKRTIMFCKYLTCNKHINEVLMLMINGTIVFSKLYIRIIRNVSLQRKPFPWNSLRDLRTLALFGKQGGGKRTLEKQVNTGQRAKIKDPDYLTLVDLKSTRSTVLILDIPIKFLYTDDHNTDYHI